MRKLFITLFASCAIGSAATAAPGDTTWVQANINQLDYYGNFDTTINFPSGTTTYRNVYMIFTLGKYVCPGSPTYCGDWDYTVQNYLMTPSGDTLELSRLITPYANSGAPRTPNTWKQRYVFDVTDYVALLQGSATTRIHYSGYSGGFTADVKFAFVEGTPDRDVKGYERLWNGSYSYGGATDINTYFPTVNTTAPTGTASAELKFNITGHGSDNNGCCEFYSRNYSVKLNTTTVATKAIWRDNCGVNDLWPQSGTWLYDRANWCPGALVNPNFHALPGISAGSTFDVGLNFESYTSPGGSLGSYTTETHLFFYGPLNKTIDAGIEDIVSPNNNENHFRANPICNTPIITVKNHGSTAITSLTIEYGVQDSVMQTFTWSGTLNSLATTDIALPELISLHFLAGTTGTSKFVARITAVNGAASDDDATNNTMTSTFAPSPKWDSQFRILFKPNNQVAGGVSETDWKIYDKNNVIVAQRVGAAINTQYIDTITLPSGCYKLEITDGGCDGLHWWVYDANPGLGINAGSFFVKKYGSNANILMNGFTYGGTYGQDFGCKFTQYFFTGTPVAEVIEVNSTAATLETYPNPANGVINIDISGLSQINGTLTLIDALGRVVKTQFLNNSTASFTTNELANGVYTVTYIGAEGYKLQQRVVVAK